jgi:ABC-type multidrug transport system ATPase subunit
VKAIQTRGVEKRYGRIRALRDVELEIPRGVALLVAGPNGAGKSTLLRVLAGLTRPTHGEGWVLGEPLFGSGAWKVRGRVGFLGSETGLYAELTVRENLTFCARLQGVDFGRIAVAIEALELVEYADQPVRTLSLGYRRRTGLARVLLGRPDILLLDEPWNGLDVEASERLDRLLREYREEREPTLLVAAHGLDGGHPLFDDTLRIQDGAVQL